MIYKLGVTGGIGSGKSTICRIFEVMGIPVFYSDEEARSIMDSTESIKSGLEKILGFDVYRDGELDRQELADVIFNDADLLKQVNKLVHPIVFDAFQSWAESCQSPYVILESAVLFTSGSDKRVDKILAVVAPLEERIQRVMDRNNITRSQVTERINMQVSESVLRKGSDFIVENNDSAMVLPGIIMIHNELLQLIKN